MNQMEAPDYTGEFIGTVVDNEDPDKRQRIKVTIPGLLEGDADMLPWISPTLQSDFGMTDDAGVMQVPAKDSLIKVFFQNGDVHYGLSSGYLHTGKHTPDPDLLKNYPFRRGWKDPAGHKMWIDRKEGEEEFHYEHPTGTMITINKDGRITIEGVENLEINIKGDTKIATKGDTTISTDGDTKITTKGQTDINSEGNTNITGETINLNNS